MAQAAVTERWPWKEEKRQKISFRKKNKNNIFFIYIFLLCQDIGGNTPGTARAAVTERWPWKEEKTAENKK